MNSLLASRADWYLMRATGIVSLILLTGVLTLGIVTAQRWRTPRLPLFVTAQVHRSVSLVAVAFLAIHVTTAIADPVAQVALAAALVPFSSQYAPFWVGLGTVALELVAALVVSSLLRRHISAGLWRGIHWAAYAAWPLAVLHGLGAGTDRTTWWLMATLLTCMAVVLTALLWRTGALEEEPHPAGR